MKAANIAFTVLLCAFLSSCYHLGVPGGSKRVTVGDITNRTAEPSLGGLLSQGLAEEFGTRPGLHAKDAAEYEVDARIVGIGNASQARAEVRVKKARDKDGDAYQTVLHKLTIKVEYSVRDSSGKVVLKGKVAGQASVPLMHDREVALLSARKLAVKDAARQIADALADNH